MSVKIKGEVDEYKVGWVYFGVTGAVPEVYKYKKFMIFGYWSKVREGQIKSSRWVERSSPQDILKWFKDAVNEYERYDSDWNEYKENKQ